MNQYWYEVFVCGQSKGKVVGYSEAVTVAMQTAVLQHKVEELAHHPQAMQIIEIAPDGQQTEVWFAGEKNY